MNINENILLAIIGFDDLVPEEGEQVSSQAKRDVEKKIVQIKRVWNHYNYSIVHFNGGDLINPIAVEKYNQMIKINTGKVVSVLESTLKDHPFSRIIVMGIVSIDSIELLTEFATTNALKVYHVTDGLFCEKSEVDFELSMRKVTTQQILTLFKSIRD